MLDLGHRGGPPPRPLEVTPSRRSPRSADRLTGLAWVTVLLHLAGLALALLGMRPGTALVPLETRMRFLGTHPAGWTAGWIVWMLCALSLVWFLFRVAGRFPPVLPAAILAAAGAAIDLTCDAVQIAVLPVTSSRELFLVVEACAGLGGQVVANGFYCLAIWVATRSIDSLDRAGRALGLAALLAGLVLSLGGLCQNLHVVQAATGPAILLFCAWSLRVARAGRAP
jgi:hypothetical protein